MMEILFPFMQIAQPKRRKKRQTKRFSDTLCLDRNQLFMMDSRRCCILAVTLLLQCKFSFQICCVVHPLGVLLVTRSTPSLLSTGIIEALLLVLTTRLIFILFNFVFESCVILLLNVLIRVIWNNFQNTKIYPAGNTIPEISRIRL